MGERHAFRELTKRWRRTIDAAAEPLHRDEAKWQAGLAADVSDWDADFDRWISAARRDYEERAEVALITQTWELVLERFPSHGWPIELFRPPVQAIVSIAYVDMAGESQTLDLAECDLDLGSWPALVAPRWGTAWPACRVQPRAVVVTFRAGFATPCTADAAADTLTPLPQIYAEDAAVRLSVSGGALPAGLAARTDYFALNAGATTLQLAATAGGAAVDLTDAGSGALFLGEVPDQALQALRLAAAHWQRNREAVGGTNFSELPIGWDALVHSLKWRD